MPTLESLQSLFIVPHGTQVALAQFHTGEQSP